MEFKFADIGEGITEGEIVEWLVKEGDKVKADQVLCKIETDKAVVDLPSPSSGVIKKINFKSGIVKVGDTLVIIEGGSRKKKKDSGSVVGDIEEARDTPKKTTEKINLLGGIKKSAPRVVKTYDLFGHIKHIPLKGVRKATAENMSHSWNSIPHVGHFDEMDISKLYNLRKEQNSKTKGVHLTFLPFIIKAIVLALKKYPQLASEFNVDEILQKKYFNIGVAIDKGNGLFVPVIKGADQKNIFDIAKELNEFSSKVDSRTLTQMDMSGGVFTITNIGSIGGLYATPIIKPGECAILALGGIHDAPWVDEGGNIVVKKVLPLSLAFDHRVLDGALAAEFVNELIDILDNPEKLLN
jgi:pyruvate dehydrogenase E2 component (dihydrolipoamide acetyltransferase)